MTKLAITPHRNHIFFVAALMALALFTIVAMSVRSASAEAVVQSAEEHIITLHDDGVEKGFITKAKTLREAFASEGIRVDGRDVTEPGMDAKLVAASYEVNIYRARMVIIRDSGAETKVISAYRTGKQIAKQAGITLHDEDITELRPSTDIVTDGAAEVMTIKRAVAVNFEFYGKKTVAYTQAKTVADMLRSKGIKLGSSDGISPSPQTKIVKDMNIRLWRNGIQTITVDEDVAFETEQRRDANHDKGYKEIVTIGEKGRRTVSYEINMQNGVEVSRKEINSNVTKQPVKQIEIVGTKVLLPAGSHEDWMAAAGMSPGNYGYINYIFGKESGWRPGAVSSNGYYGLGQTNYTKLSSTCPNWESDPICQIKLFDGYAVGRYGSWEGAYNFWIAHHWW